ncbi:TnsA endonuclease N-terminal domain-containing protein [Rheinheimera soli]|uniref:TnsA endonuclease N-terminal domain-containing protein n=1 Tax=Rheinheimera soli TaxID=443616 RepID=UPI001E4013B6|nr:TnsA endonuclease N-terminal domain-containing protein [Rheinheimera soli]
MSMGKKRIGVTEALRTQHLQEFERGLSTGNYKPYIRTQDFSSKGIRGRIADPNSPGSSYHCMSLNETFKLIDLFRNPEICDIKEQYAYVNLEKSKSFAKALQIRHPRYKWSRLDAAITFDFFCTLRSGRHLVVSVKPERDMEEPRVQEKLLLEKSICDSEGYEYLLVLDSEIKTEQNRNLIRVLKGAKLNNKLEKIYPKWLSHFSHYLVLLPHEPLSDLIQNAATSNDVSYQESFRLMQHAFWIGHLESDPELPLLPEHSPYLLGVECHV